ncbi:unnamed protein product [Bursaphelenchus okinawaensis]|uniref:Fibronectin type-III domain-containing protein n=1 Tax=Bursaphelenchus okinawaensis TaxID=465554 RepID=A0A811L4Y5_9BILA|nr:unnamed protein product [Bursaphelenchus okinawaensis]CAG9117483.1 unnamed protein product [Bursaphelenchus okinawaensis]
MRIHGLYIQLLIITLTFCSILSIEISKRAKCSVECYIKCVTAGTPKAVYCNCPLSLEAQPCDAVTEDMLKKYTINTVPQVETSYKDVRTINIKMEPYNGAFIYIFEYSTISGDADHWSFAGASSSPSIQFNIPDACRDYQFRTMIVLRSTDPSLQFVTFRPRAIPVVLPKFEVPPESIHLDPPRQSQDNQSIHAFVTWQNPLGYDDADVYGYEQPVAYPISCQTPEDRLTQPRVELVEEQTPQCISLIDVWGKDGKAMVVWQKPEATPSYYILKYGTAEQRGARPFIARKIIQGEEIKISGNQTHAELVARPGLEYGIQICGIYSQSRNKPPFEVAQVVPFICAECPSDALDCIDCAKIEEAPLRPFVPVVECNDSNNCTNVNKEFVSSNQASLGLSPTNISSSLDNLADKSGENLDSSIQATDHPRHHSSTFIKHREPQQHQQHVASSSEGIEDITLTSAEGSGNGVIGRAFGEKVRGRFVNNDATALEPLKTTELTTEIDENFEREVPQGVRVTVMPKVVSTARKTVTVQSTTVEPVTDNQSEPQQPELRFSPTTTQAPITSTDPPTTTTVTTTTVVDETTTTVPIVGEVSFVSISQPVNPSTDKPAKADGVKLHQQTFSLHKKPGKKTCKQKSGIVCEFGCLDDLRCNCEPSDSSLPCIRGLLCPKVNDLQVVYDKKLRSLKMFSKTVAEVYNKAEEYDKMYLEFGELTSKSSRGLKNGYIFVKGKAKEHSIINIDPSTGIFDKTALILKIAEPLNYHDKEYGLAVCALNSSLVPIFNNSPLDENSMFTDTSVTSFAQSLLAPVELQEEVVVKEESHRSFLIFLGPAFLVLGVLIFGVTIVCMGMIRRRDSAAAKLRRRGLLRSQSGMQFTAYRPTLGTSPSSYYSDNTSRYYMTRNVHF